MDTIQSKFGERTHLENLIQGCLLINTSLPKTKNPEEEEWLNDYLKHMSIRLTQIVKRIDDHCSAKSRGEDEKAYRLTEDLIGKILWLDKDLPETLDEEEKAIIDKLLMREARFLNTGIRPDNNDLRDMLYEMQITKTWEDITSQDLLTMKMRGIIDDHEHHYCLSRSAYPDEFCA